jgi:hypothetical protein
VSAEIETANLNHALVHPCHGPVRVAQELMLRGIQVSSGGIRGVWQRHALLTKHERLLRLEQATAERTLELSDEQIRLLERFSPEFRERHIEAPHPGALVAVDTFFIGALKGHRQALPADRDRLSFSLRLGQALPQQAADHRRAAARCRRPAHLRGAWRHDRRRAQRQWPRVLRPAGPPPLRAIPPARGHRSQDHEGPPTIVRRHRRAPASHPLDEHFRVEGRRTWFETIEEMQAVLNAYLDGYNHRRPHQGRGMAGLTFAQAFIEGLPRTPAKEDHAKTPVPKSKAA